MEIDCVEQVRGYVEEILKQEGEEMRALVVDQETASIISLVYSRSDILRQSVYLFETLEDETREVLPHLKGIFLIRPTERNFFLLAEEILHPKYKSYEVNVTNFVAPTLTTKLALADRHRVVDVLRQVYADFYAIDRFLFSLDVPTPLQTSSLFFEEHVERMVEGITAALLAFRLHPCIRCSNRSDRSSRLATGVLATMERHATTFSFKQVEHPPVLLILDRKDDPVSPLLHQWTYRAMIHELYGIHMNRVVKCEVGEAIQAPEIVLNAEYDDFYRQNIHSNWGELGEHLRALMEDLRRKSNSTTKFDSIDAMKAFFDSYPEFKRLQGAANKHVALLSELSEIVKRRGLLAVSEVEQMISCQQDHSNVVQMLEALIDNPQITDYDIVKCLCLYALRYETDSNHKLPGLIRRYSQSRPDVASVTSLLKGVLTYAGSSVRVGDLYSRQGLFKKAKKMVKGLKGIDNVYTQHIPLLKQILDSLVNGNLSEIDYPSVGRSAGEGGLKASVVMVFIVGGATYEEEALVHQWNREVVSPKVILGANTIHNSHAFLDEVKEAFLH